MYKSMTNIYILELITCYSLWSNYYLFFICFEMMNF